MRQATALKLVPAARPHPLDGKPVLESAPLRRGHKLEDLVLSATDDHPNPAGHRLIAASTNAASVPMRSVFIIRTPP